MLDNWQRIERIFKWSKISSINAFAMHIGLKRGENLYQIRRGKNGISQELAQMIVAKFPELSKGWILSGEGEMLKQSDIGVSISDAIPYFAHDAVSVARMVEPSGATQFITLPEFDKCDFAALWLGEAMAPSIPNGAIVLLKQVTLEQIVPGEEYLILSCNFDGIRRVRRELDQNKLRLESKDRDNFDDVIIDRGDINKVFQVKGVIIKKI